MASFIEKLIVVGCSSGGKESCEYLFPRLNLGSSAAVIVPHIYNRDIYTSLQSKQLPVRGIPNPTPLISGTIYVYGHENVVKPTGCLTFLNGSVIPNPHGPDRIDDIFERAAEAYGERCIAVVLSGAGNDGARGAKQVVHHGGKILVQTERQEWTGNKTREQLRNYRCWYSRGMPTNAKRSVSPYFSGNLDRMALSLNNLLAFPV